MRRALLIAGGLAAAGLTVSLSSVAQAPNAGPAGADSASAVLADNAVAAVFNGKEIKVSDLDAEIQRKPQLAMLQAYSGGDPAVTNRIRMAALNGLINRQLLLSAARQTGSINEQEIDKGVGREPRLPIRRQG